MTEFTFYILLAVLVLSLILFVKFKPWWKYANLALCVFYLSTSLYFIFTDPMYNGFVPTVNTIILMLIHLGVLLLSIILGAIFKGKKINGI